MTLSDESQQEKEVAQQEVFERDVLPYRLAVQKLLKAGVTYKQMSEAPGSYSVDSTFERLGANDGTRSPAPYTIASIRAVLQKYDPAELDRIDQEMEHARFDAMSMEEQEAHIAKLEARRKK